MIANSALNYAQRWLGFDRSDIGIPGLEEAQLLEVCNQAVIEYHERYREGGGEPSSILMKEHGDTLVAVSTIGEDITSATTDFDVADSSSFDSSGIVAVWKNDEPDYIAYTGNAANNLTGVTGIGYSHSSGETISQVYALPSDFEDFRSETDSPDGVKVDGVPFTQNSASPRGNHFFLYDDGTTKYLSFPRGLTGDLTVSYNATATVVNDVNDTIDIPTKDLWFAVWRIAEYAAPIIGKFDHRTIAQNQAETVIRRALVNRNIGKRPKVRPMGYRMISSRSNPNYR